MDVEQINNYLSSSDKEEVQYSDAQWLYVSDNNNNQYNNYLQYITTTLKQQFIDYHNAFVWCPMALEVLNPSAANPAQNNRPPLVAMRHSVLSLIAQQTVTTDQGQTIVNDNYTQMINNLRLEIENDIGWIWSEGTDLDFALDSNFQLPAQTITSYDDFHGPSFQAFQGVEPGAANAFPIVNDPSEFGNNTLGTFTFGYGTITTPGTTNPVITSLNGIAATTTSAGEIAITFSDGRVAYFPYTAVVTAPGGVTTLGGVTISGTGVGTAVSANILPAVATGSQFTLQAVGYTNVLNQPMVSEEVTIPITFQAVSATSASVVAIGGHVLIAAGETTATGFAYGQIAGRNPNFNKGFLDRVTILQNSSSYTPIAVGAVSTLSGQTATFGGHQYRYVAILPLKCLHDFWMQLNIPIINVGFNITLYLNQSHGAPAAMNVVFPPLQTSQNVDPVAGPLIAGGTDTTPNPSIFYGVTSGAGGGSGTRLYYRSVKFMPADNARVAEKLTSGFTK